MKHLILVSHANLAFAFKEATTMIVGKDSVNHIHCICMFDGRNQEDFVEEAQQLYLKDPDGEYLILADMYGASPANSSILAFGSMKAKYRIVTGMSLGMILEILFILEDKSLDELAALAEEAARANIKTVYLVRE